MPNVKRDACPIFEVDHGINNKLTQDPQTGYPVERVYTVPNLSKGYSEGHTKQLLTDKNIASHGFTKYVRDPISECYVKTVGHEGPASFPCSKEGAL